MASMPRLSYQLGYTRASSSSTLKEQRGIEKMAMWVRNRWMYKGRLCPVVLLQNPIFGGTQLLFSLSAQLPVVVCCLFQCFESGSPLQKLCDEWHIRARIDQVVMAGSVHNRTNSFLSPGRMRANHGMNNNSHHAPSHSLFWTSQSHEGTAFAALKPGQLPL